MAQLKKSQVEAMRRLGMTEDEIKELAETDDLIDKDPSEKTPLPFDLTPEQKKVVKAYSISHSRSASADEGETAQRKKPFIPDLDNTDGKRNKKQNVSKATLVTALTDFLSTFEGCSDIVVITKDKKLNFAYNGKRYDLDLIEKREPKTK